jgi:hypothetical protein
VKAILIFFTLSSIVATMFSSVASAQEPSEQFVWNSENLNTLVAMGCAERYSRVFNQNDPEEVMLYTWGQINSGSQTIISGYCGMRFNGQYKVIDAPDINFIFDENEFNSKDDVVIEGRVGTFGIRYYFKSRTELDKDGRAVFIKTFHSLSPMNTLGMERGNYLRLIPLVESAIGASESIHGHSTFRGYWSSSQQESTCLEGMNRFAITTGVFAAKDAYSHKILYRKSDLIRNDHKMSSVNDPAEAIFISEPFSTRYKGCSYFNDKGRKITQETCNDIWSKVQFP